MRLNTLFVVALAAAVLAAQPVLAEDEPAPLAPAKPDVAVPDYGLEHLAAGDDDRPEGWTAVTESGVVPAAAPSVKAMLDLASASGASGKVDARCRTFAKGEGEARVAGACVIVGIDTSPAAFRTALDAKATAGGWHVHEFGSPMRLCVIWASNADAAKELMSWQKAVAGGKLANLAGERLFAAGRAGDQAGLQKAVQLLGLAGKIEPEGGAYHFYAGLVAAQLTRDQAAAERHLRKAFGKDVVAPAKPSPMYVNLAGQVGHSLLTKQDDAVLEEAVAVLEKAVAAEEFVAKDKQVQRFGNRYNLACAHARLKQVDKAFEQLEAAFNYLKTEWETEKNGPLGFSMIDYNTQYDHAKSNDPDMTNLKPDPRWAKFLEKYDPSPKVEATPEPPKDGDK